MIVPPELTPGGVFGLSQNLLILSRALIAASIAFGCPLSLIAAVSLITSFSISRRVSYAGTSNSWPVSAAARRYAEGVLAPARMARSTSRLWSRSDSRKEIQRVRW
jgi:hypothetical protein